MIRLILCVFLVTACDSPIQNKVRLTETEDKNQQSSLQFPQLAIAAEARWLQGPFGQITQTNTLLVVLTQNAQAYSLPEGLTLNFYATMPSMGHPMDDAGFFEEIEPGVYINRSIRYNMPGDWKNELWIMDSNFNIKDQVAWDEFF
jgi:hypothetical protein